MSRRLVPGRVEATAGVLREIVTVILALAFTGTVVTFLTRDGFAPIETTDITVPHVLIFLCVLSTIIRFYHGNVSYLDVTYAVSDSEANIRHYKGKLATDFVVFLAQAMIFSALAIYQSRTRDFFSFFVCLFIIDAIWCLINVWFSSYFEGSLAHQYLRSQMNWMSANSVAAFLIAIPLAFHWRSPDSILRCLVPYFFGVITLNAIVDYWLNRRLYFPLWTLERTGKSAFVGARFTSALGTKGFDLQLRMLIESVHEVVRERKLVVYSAHEEEQFGKALSKPEDFVRRDLEQIAESDIFIGLWDAMISPGLLIELGWASALKKQIILILPSNYNTSDNPMIQGLAQLTTCHIERYNGSVKSVKEAINNALTSVLG